LLPVELDNLGIEDLAVVECHPLAQGDVQGMVIAPLPTGRKAWHKLSVLVEFYEMLKNV
jgi:hypothetical protein